MIAPDDPRHGTYAGTVAHWLEARDQPCGPCSIAEARYRKQRKLDALRGNPRSVPAAGTIRRAQALVALGWTMGQIATEAGVSVNTLRSIQYHGSQTVHSTTAAAVRDAYERMSMTLPDGPSAARTRALARKNGWPPPLAWNNIDDENETPVGWQYQRPDRAAEIRELADHGENATQIARRLGITLDTLARWCHRELPDVWPVIAGREGDWNSNGNLAHQTLRQNRDEEDVA